MKMENARMEFVTFDTADVIATSGGGNPVEDKLTMIWLPSASVDNYNKHSDNDTDLFKLGSSAYYAYSGRVLMDSWWFADAQNATPPENMIFYVNSANDEAGYNRILQWLTDHQQ